MPSTTRRSRAAQSESVENRIAIEQMRLLVGGAGVEMLE
uniref:Uncharacterized protein n=1 Tax=Candidatus Kentrum sp. FW TaxID=2126338 RepID=A0A450S428_9GAMM|nr:MAG: hypothetical protein BECKFW1821A_GA0114235_101319 [Candidatus Kentron sp. FW]VFJ70856.1 MAG: hypothetical protein BECKFW1821B_GA0114236_12003 [Candidatus Kentron sp. FW]